MCLKPVGRTMKLKSEYLSVQLSGRDWRFSHSPPPFWDLWYTAWARSQRPGSCLGQITWGSGRERILPAQDSSFMPSPASSTR